MPTYDIVLTISTDDPTHIIKRDIVKFLARYEDAVLLDVEEYNEEADDPPYDNDNEDTTFASLQYPTNYPGHPL